MKKTKGKTIGIIIAIIVVLFAIAFSLSGFFTDILWFDELGYTSVFFTELMTKLKLGVPVFAAVCLLSVLLLATMKRSFLKKNNLVLNSADAKKRVRAVTIVLSVLFSFLFTISLISNLWFEILQFINASEFGIADPVFGKDIGFYTFKLEFLTGLAGGATAFVTALAVMTAIFYLILTAIANQDASETEIFDNIQDAIRGKTSGIKAKLKAILDIASRELSILAVLFFLSLAATFYLKRFEMLYGGSGVAYGAGYTDINVTLNVYRVMIVLSICAAVCIPIAIRLKKIKLGLLFPILIAVVVPLGSVAESAVQNLIVAPDELSKETPYLENNIKYTRLAYNLADINVENFTAEGDIDTLDVLENMETFSNIRINDFDPTQRFYNQTQSIRSYYEFTDTDVDRYNVNGEYTQVFLSAREINQNYDQNWLIKHLKYTHGYGITLSRVDKITSSGQPEMLIGSIPPVSEVAEIVIDRPEIYYGEYTNDYVITNTDEPEFNYPSGETNVYCEYEGTGGIRMTMVNRILFAVREQNLKLLISTNINSDSKILIRRNITDRIHKIAPFLALNDDPYVVVADGKIYWIVDAYTSSAYYPYSEPYSSESDCNYIRNSVKVIVDAYNGTTDFYICDKNDPLVLTLAKIYPDLFKDISEIPKSLQSHLQYPNMLFNIQASVYTKYHMTDVNVFYQNEDLWAIANETYNQSRVQMTPNYFIMKLPGESEGEFVSAIPYTPFGKSNMTGLLMARQDGKNYGQLVLYRMPKDRTIYGPEQIEAQINQDAEISKEFALWNNSGSSYIRGNLYVIPVEDAILYVEPIYLESTNTSLPEVKRVVMYYGDKVAYESTLADCLDRLFGDGAGAPLKTPYPIISGKEMAQEIRNQASQPSTPPVDEPGGDTDAEPDIEDGQSGEQLDKQTLTELAKQLTELLEKINSML